MHFVNHLSLQGIAPKLEFTTTTTINESRTPEIDALDDALKEERVSMNKIYMYTGNDQIVINAKEWNLSLNMYLATVKQPRTWHSTW